MLLKFLDVNKLMLSNTVFTFPLFSACLTSCLNFRNIFNHYNGYIYVGEFLPISFQRSLMMEINNLKIFFDKIRTENGQQGQQLSIFF